MASKIELHRIYICGLQPYVEPDDLKFHFDYFGEIYYFHFHADEGYTLISYANQRDAILAIANGNNMIIGGYPIQVQWARGYPRNRNTRYKDYSFDSVYNECSPQNCTVYCWGLSGNNSIQFLQDTFGPFGIIQDIFTKINSIHTDNAMIRFNRKEDATLAICTIDGIQVDGQTIGCMWSLCHFLDSGWHNFGGYKFSFQPAARPLIFNSSSASSTAPGDPAAAPSSTLRSPAVSSSTTVRCPIIFEASSNSSSNNCRLQQIQEQLAKLLPDSTSSDEEYSLPLTVNSSSVSSTAPGDPAAAPSSTLRYPAVSSSTTVRSPIIFEASSNSSNNCRLQQLQEQLAKLLQDSTSSDEEYTDDNFDTVFDQTGPNNFTVFCKGLNRNTTNESLTKIFNPFGIIEKIDLSVHTSDYAFIRFNTKEAATLAICSINNTKINDCLVTCTWSNRQGDQTRVQITTDDLEVSEPVTTSTQFYFPTATSTASGLSAAASALLPKTDQSSKSKKTKERNADIFCKICMDEELGIVFLPCGHLTSCSKCAQKINVCPVCRKSITSKVRTYLS